nr:cycle [Phauda flammans]
MNTYISELSSMIPMCGAMARKLDKLTVLRMAVQHLRSVRGALSAGPLTIKPRPAYLSERELNNLVLHAAHDAFIIVVGCDRGRLLYVSTSVSQMLNYDQAELLGQSLFDILHPKDVAKVKEQLSSSNICPRERLIDAKTMLPVKSEMMAGASRLGPGARRSFFCRIKCRALLAPRTPITQDSDSSDANRSTQIKEENKMRKRSVHDKKYCVVQCTGYLKSWAPADVSEGCGSSNGSGCGEVGDGGDDSDASNMCLVAVGRALHDLIPQQAMRTNFPTPATRLLQYVSRHATDGKFLFVDQRVTLALGFLPQELLGTSLYEYVGASELSSVARTHKAALLQRDSMLTTLYSHRRKDGNFATIQTQFKPFRNPWTKDVEYLVANNTVVSGEQATQLAGRSDTHTHYDIYKQRSSETGDRGGGVPPSDVERSLSESDVEMQRLIDSQVESHKIGSAIAEEVFRRSSPVFSPELPADLFQDTIFSTQSSLVDNILGLDSPYIHVRNNVSLSSAAGSSSSPLPSGDGVNTATSTEGSPPPSSPPIPPLAVDGNGEAAMAVIMSLLEAEAGLGGPVNTSGLPWPLP